MLGDKFMEIVIDETKWERVLKQKTLYVRKFNMQVMESGTKMPGSVNQGRDEVEFKDMRYTGVKFSQKARKGFLPEDGSRKGSEG